MKLLDRFKRKPRKVMLTGEDIILLRNDVDDLQSTLDCVGGQNLITLRSDVNSALSVSAKLVYQLEELEIRVAAIEERIRLFVK